MVSQDMITETEYAKQEVLSILNRQVDTSDGTNMQARDLERVLRRMLDLTRICMQTGEHEYGLEIIDFAKPYCEKLIEHATGMTLREVSDYVTQSYDFEDSRYDLYWDFVLEETYDRFEPFMFYMEKNRAFSKKFYEPRQYTKSGKQALKRVADELENLEYGKYDFLGISQPARTGKLIADYTPVLTKDGWKTHGELTVGDYVVGLNGEWVKVLYVYPKNVANKRVTFKDGSQIDCHENHEWLVHDKTIKFPIVLETKVIEKKIADGNDFELPYIYGVDKFYGNTIVKIEDIEPTSGNCITVENSIYRVGHNMIPTHNSSICIFYLCWKSLRHPNAHNAMIGHSGILVKGFFKEVYNLMTSAEYTYSMIYEHWHAGETMIQDKSAEDYTITLGDPDRFATITCRGIDGTLTGAVDVSRNGVLYIDDLVRDREHSLSPVRMEATFQDYLNKCVDRKQVGATELMVGTLWNVLDPLERLSKKYADNPRYKFLRLPALDENDESNFDYVINGFTTEYYRDMRDRLDNAEWQAKYQQSPYVREGLLFPTDQLQYFDGLVCEADIKRVYAVADSATGGGDNVSCPICYEMNDGRKLICKWIYDKRTIAYTVPRVVNAIPEHTITEMRVERNGVGALFLDKVKEYAKKQNIAGCKIRGVSAPIRMSKEDKIQGYSDTIKNNYQFLAPRSNKPSEIPQGYIWFERDPDYQNAMDCMSMYTSEGKNYSDDAPDSMAQLAIMDETKSNGQIEVIHMPSGFGL